MFNYVGPQGKEEKLELEDSKTMNKSLKSLFHLTGEKNGRTRYAGCRQ